MKGLVIVNLLLVLTLSFSPSADCSVPNCDICSESGICQKCESGHRLQFNKELSSTQCVKNDELIVVNYGLQTTVSCPTITNCASCLTPNFCSSCQSGYVINSQGNSCMLNNCTITYCLTCSSSSTCQVCQNGYILSANTCIQCQLTGCQTCSTTNVCTSCYDSYTLNLSTNTCTFTGCQYPCKSCINNGNTCQTCLPPFSLNPFDNGTCFTCQVANCAQCSSNTINICTTCTSGYTLNTNNNTCTWTCASPKCTSCPNSGSCQTCVSGYVPNGNICTQCTNAPICTLCQNNNLSYCLNCISGYWLNTTSNTCQQCPTANCAVCSPSTTSSASNTLVCTQYFGYLPYTSVTATTQTIYPYQCDQGCSQCASNYPSSCLVCANGYYITVNTNTNVGSCSPCGSNCLTCAFNTNNNIYCTSCYSNAYLVNGQCNVCSSNNNCLTCSSSNYDSCTSCPFGYYLTTVPATGDKVSYNTCTSQCPQNCLTCFNAANTQQANLNPNNIACSSCNTGYSLTIAGACLPCLSNCRVCSGQFQQICLQCGTGYYLNSNYQCSACGAGCQSCTSNTACVTCAPGFNLQASGSNSTICALACTFPCVSCNLNAPAQCTSCAFGYVLSTSPATPNTCIQASTCVASNSNGCEYCPQGQILSNGACSSCGTNSNCARCSSSSTSYCTTCYPGYYLTQPTNTTQTCAACPVGCLSCNGPTYCLSCSNGFTISSALASYVTGNQVYCVPCAAPCSQCVQNPFICTACINGFYFNGWSCVSNFYYTFNIGLAATQQTFFNNYQAFIKQFGYAMQTQNMNDLAIQTISTSTTANSTYVTTYISTFQQSGSYAAALEYYNLQYALVDNGGVFAGMSVLNTSLGLSPGGSVPTTHSDVPTIVGIVVPLSVLLIVAIIYYIFSRNNMDLPGSDYIPPESQRDREATQMRAI